MDGDTLGVSVAMGLGVSLVGVADGVCAALAVGLGEALADGVGVTDGGRSALGVGDGLALASPAARSWAGSVTEIVAELTALPRGSVTVTRYRTVDEPADAAAASVNDIVPRFQNGTEAVRVSMGSSVPSR